MRYPVLTLVVVSLAGTVAAFWAIALGHVILAVPILAVTFVIIRVVILHLTRLSARRRMPPEG